MTEPERKYTLQRGEEDLRDKKFAPSKFAKASNLPISVDLRPKMPPIYDHGKLGSCTANAWGALLEYWNLQDENKQNDITPSRLFIYYYERLLNGTVAEDVGAKIRDGGMVLNKYGTCSENDLPYDINNFRSEPHPSLVEKASQFKIPKYHCIDNHMIMKAALAEGIPVVIGIQIFESFENIEVKKTGIVSLPKEGEINLGGHAVLNVGYDDEKQHWIVRNSWGTFWGDKGYFYLPYEYITKGLSFDFWTLKYPS